MKRNLHWDRSLVLSLQVLNNIEAYWHICLHSTNIVHTFIKITRTTSVRGLHLTRGLEKYFFKSHSTLKRRRVKKIEFSLHLRPQLTTFWQTRRWGWIFDWNWAPTGNELKRKMKRVWTSCMQSNERKWLGWIRIDHHRSSNFDKMT